MAGNTVTARELAAALGVSTRAVHMRANRDGWEFKTMNARGDRAYLIGGLPAGVRARLIQGRESSYIKGMILPSRGDLDLGQARALLAKFEAAPAWSRRRAEARGEIVEAFDRFAEGRPVEEAKNHFLRRYNAGNNHLGIPGEVYEVFSTISRGSLNRWRGEKKRFGLTGLLDTPRRREKFAQLTEEMAHYIIGIKTKRIHTRPVRIYEYLHNHFSGEDIPSETTIRRFIRGWEEENASLVAYLTNPDRWKNEYQAAFGDASEKALHYLHMVEFDNTPADVMCSDGRRYTITGGIDIFSRKAKCQVVPTSRSQAVANLFRSIILDWGLFDTAVMDNGQDYASKHIEAACAALGVELVFNPPFTPEAKPHVERFFRTLSTGLFEELSGYVGHSVAERKAIESRKSFAARLMKRGGTVEIRMMPDELQEVIDTWVEEVYHQREHSTIKAAPAARAAQGTQPVKRILDERVLDILLAPAGTSTVTKKGIRFEGGLFAAPELVVGQKVHRRRNPADAGTLYVFDEEMNFICIAKDTALEGLTVEDVTRARKRQRKQVVEQARALKKLAEGVGDPMAELLEAKRKGSGRLAGFHRSEEWRGGIVNEAEKAAREPEHVETFEKDVSRKGAKAQGEKTEDQKRRSGEAESNVVPIREAPLFASGLERCKYLTAQEKVRTLTDTERAWLDGYMSSEEYYRVFVMPYE